MKHLLRIFSVAALAGTLCAGAAQAQDIKPAIAFVKADRSQLFVKKTDSTEKVVLTAHAPYLTSITNLAILGQTPGGGTYLLGGSFTYFNISSSTQTTFTGIVAVPSDFDATSALSLAKLKFLKAAPNGLAAFRPLGAVSSDGREWFCTFTSSKGGNQALIFFHGNMDGTGAIDSATLTGGLADKAVDGGFHISNLALSPDNSTMVAVSVDHLDDPKSERFQLYRWNIKAFGGPQFNVSGDFASSIKSQRTQIQNVDSLFGLTVRVEDDTWMDLALANVQQSDNSIDFYRIRYNSANISLTPPQQTIARNVLPADVNFFAGMNVGSYQENESDDAQLGAGGDMMFNAAGDQVVFVTHESPDNANNRYAKSAIYTYKFGDAKAKLVYNDPNAQELQPIFVDALYATPAPVHYPGISLNINDFGPVFTDTTATTSLDIHNDSLVLITIKSATITGADASQFTLVTNPANQTIQPGASTKIDVKFTPTGAAGTRTAILKVVFNSDSSKSITLGGRAAIRPHGGVSEDAALAQNVTMQPNPFSSVTAIRLTSPSAGSIGIVVHDALGRVVYTSEIRQVSAGSVETFEFNAQSLSLPNGVYYVSAIFGDKQVSRQIVYVR